MKSTYKRMTKYKIKEIKHIGVLIPVITRADVELNPFSGEYRANSEEAHAATNYADKVISIYKRLRIGDEWYMVWTKRATEGDIWK